MHGIKILRHSIYNYWVPLMSFWCSGAGEGTRTPTALRPLGPKPSASTSSATPASMEESMIVYMRGQTFVRNTQNSRIVFLFFGCVPSWLAGKLVWILRGFVRHKRLARRCAYVRTPRCRHIYSLFFGIWIFSNCVEYHRNFLKEVMLRVRVMYTFVECYSTKLAVVSMDVIRQV